MVRFDLGLKWFEFFIFMLDFGFFFYNQAWSCLFVSHLLVNVTLFWKKSETQEHCCWLGQIYPFSVTASPALWVAGLLKSISNVWRWRGLKCMSSVCEREPEGRENVYLQTREMLRGENHQAFPFSSAQSLWPQEGQRQRWTKINRKVKWVKTNGKKRPYHLKKWYTWTWTG